MSSPAWEFVKNLLRSIPYQTVICIVLASSGFKAAVHGYEAVRNAFEPYIVHFFSFHKYEKYIYIAFSVSLLLDLVLLIQSITSTGWVQEQLCARRAWPVRLVGRVFLALASIVVYATVLANIAMLSAAVSGVIFRALFLYTCDKANNVVSTTCIDLSAFSLGNNLCGPSFTQFCHSISHSTRGLLVLLGGLVALVIAQVNMLVIVCSNYQRIKARVGNDGRSDVLVKDSDAWGSAGEYKPLLSGSVN